MKKIIPILKSIAAKISSGVGLNTSLFEAPYLISVIVILLFCSVAGTIAKLRVGKWMVNWIEDHILALFPGYQLMKSTLQSNVGLIGYKEFSVVLVPIDG